MRDIGSKVLNKYIVCYVYIYFRNSVIILQGFKKLNGYHELSQYDKALQYTVYGYIVIMSGYGL